jgi:hypothetical protein
VRRADVEAVAFAVLSVLAILAVVAVALWAVGPAPVTPTTPGTSTVDDECRVEYADPAGWPICAPWTTKGATP